MKFVAYNHLNNANRPYFWLPALDLVEERHGRPWHIPIPTFLNLSQPNLLWLTLPAASGWSAEQKLAVFVQLDAFLKEEFGQGFDAVCMSTSEGALSDITSFFTAIDTLGRKIQKIGADFSGSDETVFMRPEEVDAARRQFNDCVMIPQGNGAALLSALGVTPNDPAFTSDEITHIRTLFPALEEYYQQHHNIARQRDETLKFNFPVRRP